MVSSLMTFILLRNLKHCYLAVNLFIVNYSAFKKLIY